MELLPLIYKALFYGSIAIVVILVFSFVTYKIKQKRKGDIKPYEKYQKKKTEKKEEKSAPKVKQVERTEKQPEVKEKNIVPEEKTSNKSPDLEKRYPKQNREKPVSHVKRIERIVTEIEKHRPKDETLEEYDSRRSVRPIKNEKRMEVIKPNKPSDKIGQNKFKSKEASPKISENKENSKPQEIDILSNYSDDENLDYTVKVDKTKNVNTNKK